jgi:hypothetical protein
MNPKGKIYLQRGNTYGTLNKLEPVKSGIMLTHLLFSRDLEGLDPETNAANKKGKIRG